MTSTNLHKNMCGYQILATVKFMFVIVVIALSTYPLALSAQGDLLITPRRVVFEGNRQQQEITLANTGQDTAKYSISFVQYRMTEEGGFEQIESPEPGQFFADAYLRFFPRSVTLAPNESQVVRMQLRRLPDMVNGEYRSHMYFRAVPDEKPLGEEDMLADTSAIGIRLTPIFGITIPVIIRIGELNAGVRLSNLTLKLNEDTPPDFSLTMNREGNQSVYGDLTINYVPSVGEPIEVGIVRGIAIYTPNSKRNFSMQLSQPDGVDYSSGKLVVRYSSASEAKPEMYDEQELLLNK
ncbi:MAG: molecular chaperone [Bacteroidales bacterium]|nr:molecular chaperone [Bacteroidales bacterium]